MLLKIRQFNLISMFRLIKLIRIISSRNVKHLVLFYISQDKFSFSSQTKQQFLSKKYKKYFCYICKIVNFLRTLYFVGISYIYLTEVFAINYTWKIVI